MSFEFVIAVPPLERRPAMETPSQNTQEMRVTAAPAAQNKPLSSSIAASQVPVSAPSLPLTSNSSQLRSQTSGVQPIGGTYSGVLSQAGNDRQLSHSSLAGHSLTQHPMSTAQGYGPGSQVHGHLAQQQGAATAASTTPQLPLGPALSQRLAQPKQQPLTIHSAPSSTANIPQSGKILLLSAFPCLSLNLLHFVCKLIIIFCSANKILNSNAAK